MNDSPGIGEMVRFLINGAEAAGYLAIPVSGEGPGVLVIQEWWGLVDHIRNVVDRFAEAGFVALAPDLYHGQETAEPEEAGKLMMALALPRASKDMTAAVEFLVSHPATTSPGVGAVGFCMGGGLVLWVSSLSPAVTACVPFYGLIPWDDVQPDYSKASAAYLGHYAELDDMAGPEGARRLETQLRDAGREATIHLYPGTQHAFFNDDRPEVHDPDASAVAWDRTISFLKDRLG